MDAAYDARIRYFYVASMYRRDLAEAELGSFLKRRRADVAVTTKLGINPMLFAREIARFQGPMRTLLAKRPKFREGLKDSIRGAHSRTPGHLLYSSLAHALPILREFLAHPPDALDMWSERPGVNLAEESNLPGMLLSVALRRNVAGPVVFSTIRPQRARVAAEAATPSAGLSDAKAATFKDLAATARSASLERIQTP